MGEDTHKLPAIMRIQTLAERDIEHVHVVSSFLSCVTAPLMSRSHSGGESWGHEHTMRLWVGRNSDM
jgi:hypothetical protein